MTLAASDWAAIVGYLLITLFLGLYFRGRSGKSTEDYFVSGRNVSWWLAGTSMVATTFAADTPLVVTGLVYANGQGSADPVSPYGGYKQSGLGREWGRWGYLEYTELKTLRYSA